MKKQTLVIWRGDEDDFFETLLDKAYNSKDEALNAAILQEYEHLLEEYETSAALINGVRSQPYDLITIVTASDFEFVSCY